MKLTILSALVVLATFAFRVIFSEWLKDLQNKITNAENFFRAELSATALQAQLTSMEIDRAADRRNPELREAKRNQDFTKFIQKDRLIVSKCLGDLTNMEGCVVRVLKALPWRPRKAGLKSFIPIQNKVKKAAADARESINSSLSGGKDWADSGLLKIQVMRVALVEIEVALFADQVLTQAIEVRDGAEHLYHLCKWISYFLFAAGIGLAVYANLAGIKTMIGGG